MRFSAQISETISAFYNTDGKFLEFVSVHRDLCVLVDFKLKFHGHVTEVVQTAGGFASELLRSTVGRSLLFIVSLFVLHIRQLWTFVLAFGTWATRVMSGC